MTEDRKTSEDKKLQKSGEPVTVPVKIDGVTKNISLEEAEAFIEKGLKFDMIRENYEKAAALAEKENLSVEKFLEKIQNESLEARKAKLTEMCKGDGKLAEHIMELEAKVSENNSGFEELYKFFPQFRTEKKLPYQVTEAVRLKGTKPLDEFLRYSLMLEKAKHENEKNRRNAENAGIGSQKHSGGTQDSVNYEFLRGIWNI